MAHTITDAALSGIGSAATAAAARATKLLEIDSHTDALVRGSGDPATAGVRARINACHPNCDVVNAFWLLGPGVASIPPHAARATS